MDIHTRFAIKSSSLHLQAIFHTIKARWDYCFFTWLLFLVLFLRRPCLVMLGHAFSIFFAYFDDIYHSCVLIGHIHFIFAPRKDIREAFWGRHRYKEPGEVGVKLKMSKKLDSTVCYEVVKLRINLTGSVEDIYVFIYWTEWRSGQVLPTPYKLTHRRWKIGYSAPVK